ncbi:MAG: TRAP transporter permease [Thermodesulfobacteriota bacterium]
MSWSAFWQDRPVYQRIGGLVAVALAVFHIYTALFGSLDALMQRSIHLGMGLILAFLVHPTRRSAKGKGAGRLNFFLIASVILMIGYLFARYEWVTVNRFPLISPVHWYEKILGVLAILLVLEAARRVVSPGLLYVVVAFLIYPLVGPYLPGVLHSSPLGWTAIVDFNYLSLGGIFGIPLGVSATEIALFIIFGSVLMRSGGSQLISDLATAMAGRYVGGPAKVAVVASSMMGTITGSATANVATVGSITIPMMKKAGYSPTFAAAVEAVASCGGQIMPPVMGAAAFVMSSFSGIPYVEICYYALFPAILYYLTLFFTVDLEARRLKLKTSKPDLNLGSTLREYGHMIVPIAVLLYVLIAGYTPRLAGALGTLAAIAASQFRKKTRMSFLVVLDALEHGAKGMLIVCISTAAAGIICGTVDLTGLGQRFGSAFMDLTGGNMLLGLFLCMFIAILLGLGLPTTPAYIVQAATVIPALIKMGLPMPAAHLFAFYYSCLALITPPDASAAYTAASLAGANGWRTGWLATRIAFVAFVVPFMFVFDNSLLLMGGLWAIAGSILTASVGTWCLAASGEAYLFGRLNWIERAIVGIAALLLLFPSMKLGLVGAAATALVAISSFRSRDRRKMQETVG